MKSPAKFPWPGSTQRALGWIRPSEKEAPELRSQLRLDRVEIGGKLAAYALHRRDDRNRDAGGNESVFDSGSPRFVSEKLLENVFQLGLLLKLGRSNVSIDNRYNLRFIKYEKINFKGMSN